MSAPASAFAALETGLEEKRARVEAALRRLAVPGSSPAVEAAVESSLFAPAKRLRPILALMVADALRGDADSVLPAACALEMVHTASLILDDLPSMDDATARRGRPACHIAHGEANAVLAAFALLNRAYEVIADGWPGGPDPATRVGLAAELARAVGLSGMIAGQAEDLAATDRTLDFATLEFIHRNKTGALFMASAAVGAAAARASAADRAALVAYAKNLGLAFQIVDDLIDATGAMGDAGKDVGKDVKKTTFVSFAGVAGAWQLAGELIDASEAALAGFGPRAQPLRDLARYVVSRRR
jgi:geranylgeranyl diphosphate synthase type II